MVKGPLAGFIIADPKWEQEDVDSIMEKLSLPTEIVTSPVLEDENFIHCFIIINMLGFQGHGKHHIIRFCGHPTDALNSNCSGHYQ